MKKPIRKLSMPGRKLNFKYSPEIQNREKSQSCSQLLLSTVSNPLRRSRGNLSHGSGTISNRRWEQLNIIVLIFIFIFDLYIMSYRPTHLAHLAHLDLRTPRKLTRSTLIWNGLRPSMTEDPRLPATSSRAGSPLAAGISWTLYSLYPCKERIYYRRSCPEKIFMT